MKLKNTRRQMATTIIWNPRKIGRGGKVVPVLLLTEHHAMKAYWGSGGTAPAIL
jgi:hypothetical protein